jgi:hypothetical protein
MYSTSSFFSRTWVISSSLSFFQIKCFNLAILFLLILLNLHAYWKKLICCSVKFKRLFVVVCFKPHEQFFSYLAAVTITGDRAANLDLCSGPLSREGSLSCHTYCDTGPRFIRSHPKDRHPRPTVGFERIKLIIFYLRVLYKF